MTAAVLTITGNVATDVAREVKKNGEPWVHFRVACNDRYLDERTGLWTDREPSFYTVVCWKAQLARNVDASLAKGDPVVVHGKVRIREWRKGDESVRYTAEISANTVGHDLVRGTSAFVKTQGVSRSMPDEDELREKLAPYMIDENDVDQLTGEVVVPPEWNVASEQPADGPTKTVDDEDDDEGDRDDTSGDLAGVGLAAA